jgi:hypothetical protein
LLDSPVLPAIGFAQEKNRSTNKPRRPLPDPMVQSLEYFVRGQGYSGTQVPKGFTVEFRQYLTKQTEKNV